MRLAGALILCSVVVLAADVNSSSPVTFHKDVAQILEKNCQTCHRARSDCADVVPDLSECAAVGQGDAKDAPAAVEWPSGWAIQPDVIIAGPTTDVPASPKNNVVEWMTVTMPTGFTEDTWITSVQIKPEHPAVTHHICTAFIPHVPNIKYGVAYWQDKERDA